IHREVQLAQLTNARPQEAAGVHHQPYRLAAFDLKQLGNVLAAPGGGSPADIAKFVARLVFAKTLKLASHAALAYQPLFQLDMAGPSQIDVVTLRLFEVGKDSDGLFQACTSPSLREARRTLIAKVGAAKGDIAALQRANRVFGHCFPTSRRHQL